MGDNIVYSLLTKDVSNGPNVLGQITTLKWTGPYTYGKYEYRTYNVECRLCVHLFIKPEYASMVDVTDDLSTFIYEESLQSVLQELKKGDPIFVGNICITLLNGTELQSIIDELEAVANHASQTIPV